MTLSNTSCTAQGGSGGVLDPAHIAETIAAMQRAIMANPIYNKEFGGNPVAAFGLANSAYNAFRDSQPASSQARIRELEKALELARKRIEYYGTIGHRRHFDHDLVEIFPKIDAALSRKDAL